MFKFALRHRDRVCHVRLRMLVSILQRLVEVINDEYQVLEYLILASTRDANTHLIR